MGNSRVESQLSTISRLMIWQSRNAINGFWKRALFVKIGDVVALTAAYNALSLSPHENSANSRVFLQPMKPLQIFSSSSVHTSSVFLSLSFSPLPPLRRPFFNPCLRFFSAEGFRDCFFFFFSLFLFFPPPPSPLWPGCCFACTREDNRKNARKINISRICIAFYRLNPVARKLVVETIPLGAIVLPPPHVR